jgi:hypothetical protein
MSQIKIVQIAHDDELGSLYLDDKGRVWCREVKTYGERPEVPETVIRWQRLELPEEPAEAAS